MAQIQQNILYSFRRCPWAIRARLALIACEIEYQHREVILRDKPKSLLEYSPKATVPVLVLKNGRIIDESFDIMLWALEQNDKQNWMVGEINDHLAWIKPIETDFLYHLERYKYASRYEGGVNRASVNLEHRDKALNILYKYEKALSKSKYLISNNPSLADMAIISLIRQFSMVEPDWWQSHKLENLRNWLTSLLDTELFAKVMQKHPQWPTSK